MLDSSADDRNPVLPIFPIGHQRGLLHSSEIGFGESALGQKRRFWYPGRMSALPSKATARAAFGKDRDVQKPTHAVHLAEGGISGHNFAAMIRR
jgi:hypothetical protein